MPRRADDPELAALRALQFHVEPLAAFIARMSPKYPVVPPHLHDVVDVFERSRHREVYATVAMPPRFGKTTTYAHALAWRALYDPACLNFYVTFADDLARTTSREVRRLARGAGVPLAGDMQQVTDWRTALGGGLKATSTGGSITGRGCNGGVIIVDDGIKGREQAESKLFRDRAWDHLRADVMSRLEAGASMVVGNTRWHDDDPIGRIKKDPMGLNWIHIELPAVIGAGGAATDERTDPAARALWPAGGWDLERLRSVRARGEYDWWSLYQQRPRPKGGRLFEGEPARFKLAEFSLIGKRGVIVCDPAATAKTSADHSAIQVWAMDGYGDNAKAYLVYAWRGQVTIPALCRELLVVQKKYALLVAVEAIGGFKAVPQLLREAAPGLRILEITARGGDKFARAQPYSGAWNSGRIHVPVDVPWADSFIVEHHAFTGLGDAEDDQVDTGAHGWNTLYREASSQRAREVPEYR